MVRALSTENEKNKDFIVRALELDGGEIQTLARELPELSDFLSKVRPDLSASINASSKFTQIKKGLLVGEQLNINPLEIYNMKVLIGEKFFPSKTFYKNSISLVFTEILSSR